MLNKVRLVLLSFHHLNIQNCSEILRKLKYCLHAYIENKIFVDQLDKLLNSIFHKGELVIVVGDFHAWGDVDDDADANEILTLMYAYGFTQLIWELTHKGGHTLNHIYTNQYQIELEFKVIRGTLKYRPLHNCI